MNTFLNKHILLKKTKLINVLWIKGLKNQFDFWLKDVFDFQHCSPCLIEYDAIIKLESAREDEDFVLSQSSMNQYIDLEYRHYKSNGQESTENLRQKYFSNITCSDLTKLVTVYQMDLKMFDYSDETFREICKNNQ